MSEPATVTVGELIAALSTFPAEAIMDSAENGGGGGELLVFDGNDLHTVWNGWDKPAAQASTIETLPVRYGD